MIPWEHLDTATIPGGDETLRLKRRGSEYSIMLGTTELMNSRLSGSEEALASLAVGALGNRARPHVLIGGLGMGFTLRAALAALPADATVTVVEIVPAVQAYLADLRAELKAKSGTASAEQARSARADATALRLAEQRREMIPVEDADNAIAHVVGAINIAMTAFPARVTRDPRTRRKVDDIAFRVRDAIAREVGEL